jgi:predicted AlkP superfamily pyrophosphatase or phosphodiesterase
MKLANTVLKATLFFLPILPSTGALAQSAHDPIPLDSVNHASGRAAAGTRGPRSHGEASSARPKLVVLLVADMFRLDYLSRYASDFGSGGFRRLLKDGAVWTGRYGHQNTYTAAGHALLASGSYPYINGIMQNKWYNQATKRVESMLSDPSARLLQGETTPEDETSPRNFNGSTIGDELRLATPASKVVTLAIKDRGAILLGGRTGKAYFMADPTGDMISSTYYMSELPAWARAFNARKLPDAAFGKTWDRLLPPNRYDEPDDYRAEFDGKGMGRTFPHKLTGKLSKPGPDFYNIFTHSPFGLDYTFAFAQAALDGEELGKRGVTDMLGVSITPTDISGHAFGPYSQEMHDMVVRVDQSLASFLSDLDRRFRPGEVLVVFTADHGAVPIPEWSDEHQLSGVRMKKATIKKTVEDALNTQFGQANWVAALEDPSIYLNREVIAQKKLDPAAVERVAGEAVLGLPGFLTYYTRTQLQNGWLPPTHLAEVVARAFSPTRSGDVVTVMAPFSFWGKYAEKDWGTTHGSPFRYDTDVPLIMMGKSFRPGYYGESDMVDLAATLAEVLGVTPPAGCEGHPRIEALK